MPDATTEVTEIELHLKAYPLDGGVMVDFRVVTTPVESCVLPAQLPAALGIRMFEFLLETDFDEEELLHMLDIAKKVKGKSHGSTAIN